MPFEGQYRITTPYIVPEHMAYDHATPTDTRLVAMRAGTVVYAGWDDRFPEWSTNGRGIYVDVDHGIIDGARWISRELHMSSCVVKVGQRVAQGQILGLSGTTGLSTGPHVHTSLFRDGVPVDWLPLVG